MILKSRWLAVFTCLALACVNQPAENTDNTTDDVAGTTDNGDDTTIDTTDTTDNTDSGDGVTLTGKINGDAAKQRPAAQANADDAGYMIVAQSNDTGALFRGTSDADGEFQLDIPTAESGNTFIVTIVAPNGQAEGPVMFGSGGGAGKLGLMLEGATSLGTLVLPADANLAPIESGNDATVKESQVDGEVTARLNDAGAPVGLDSVGKGEATRLNDAPAGGADTDRDGLIGMLDADDDGDGIVDDFDGAGDVGGGTVTDARANFFMNLKVGVERAPTYYDSTADEINTALASDTIITFEVLSEPSAKRKIVSATMLETPAPDYFFEVDQLGADAMGGQSFTPWADSGYAFDEKSDRFDAFIRPNAVMAAGDTFTVEIAFDDGTTEQYTRMINYVFLNIPRLQQFGADGAFEAFDVNSATENGSPSRPITFDGAKDLVLVFNPPPDETGALLTALDYGFSIFYINSGGQQIQGIDGPATFPTPPVGFSTNNTTLNVSADDLVLSADDTYSVTLPQAILVDTVQTATGAQAVSGYQIDITALAPSGNCALLLRAEKQ